MEEKRAVFGRGGEGGGGGSADGDGGELEGVWGWR